MSYRLIVYFLVSLVACSGCNLSFSTKRSVYSQYGVFAGRAKPDSAAQVLIKPFRDSLSARMDVVIGTSEMELVKQQPESTLGNFCADAILDYTLTLLPEKRIHASVINYGGLRIPALPKGEITVGKIYELMPFDNFITVVWISGDSLQSLCNTIAAAGGWPVAGLSFRIENKKAVDIKVQNAPVVTSSEYGIVVSDYLANGGDNMTMLRTDKMTTTGVFMRDALINYIKSLDKPITVSLEQRIVK